MDTVAEACYEQNLSLSFFFISFHFIFIFHLISTISWLIPISYLLFPHCLHLVSLSHYFISISPLVLVPGLYPLPWFSYLYPLSLISYLISIALVLLSLSIVSYLLSYTHCLGSLISIHCLLSLISIHCLLSHSFHTIYTSLLSFES